MLFVRQCATRNIPFPIVSFSVHQSVVCSHSPASTVAPLTPPQVVPDPADLPLPTMEHTGYRWLNYNNRAYSYHVTVKTLRGRGVEVSAGCFAMPLYAAWEVERACQGAGVEGPHHHQWARVGLPDALLFAPRLDRAACLRAMETTPEGRLHVGRNRMLLVFSSGCSGCILSCIPTKNSPLFHACSMVSYLLTVATARMSIPPPVASH